MKTYIPDIILSIPRTFLENGIQPTTPRDLRKRILRLNLFLSFAITMALTGLAFSFVNQLFMSAMAHLGAVFLFTVAFFLIKDGHIRTSRVIGMLTINFHVIVISHLEGFRSDTYLLIFPLLLMLVFVTDIRRSYGEIALAALTTLSTILLIVMFMPYENGLQKIPDELYEDLQHTNLAISLILTIVFALIIHKTLDNHELKITEEMKLSETIYDTSLDAVFIVHAESGYLTGCNIRALELFSISQKNDVRGLPAERMLGIQMARKLETYQGIPHVEQTAWYGNMELARPQGVPFHAHVNLVPFSHQQQRYIKISILDITEIKSAEFEIIRAKEKAEKATRVKSRFLSMISHELRTPLNGIIGTTELLLQDKYLDSQRPYMDVLRHSSEHMLRLINDILDFSKLEAGKMELEQAPFHLGTFLNKAAAPFIHEQTSRVPLWLEIDPALNTEVCSDELRLNQVLNNLLSNARKFTSEGHIILQANLESRTDTQIMVRFAVRDTGIGIPPGKLHSIFERFTQADAETTRKFGGTGLGLAISRHLVERMGGSLNVISKPGTGSEFHFCLSFKLKSSIPVTEQPLPSIVMGSLQGLRIIIAEDNPVNMIVARRFLQKWDVEIIEAKNGKELIARYGQSTVDLLLVDLDMPEMDGVQAVAEIRRKDTVIPVIAFTAAVYEDIDADLRNKGFNDFVPKPFKPEMLHAKIKELTDARIGSLTGQA
jgi:signal transduction histidine kinase/ActR/RegA family two-component response regulator